MKKVPFWLGMMTLGWWAIWVIGLFLLAPIILKEFLFAGQGKYQIYGGTAFLIVSLSCLPIFILKRTTRERKRENKKEEDGGGFTGAVRIAGGFAVMIVVILALLDPLAKFLKQHPGGIEGFCLFLFAYIAYCLLVGAAIEEKE
jgi:peptidoglycan biosynthesis protein MviN/MurJ (putative lipid II flippase)